jgi:hypothetical protein
MRNIDYEIIIPIYNEGKNILKVLNFLNKFIKYKIRVLLCYDLSNDNIFEYKKELSKFKSPIAKLANG